MVVEALGSCHWIVNEIKSAGMKPKLANSHRAKLKICSFKRTNRLDALFLKQPWTGTAVEYGDVKNLAATIDKIMTVKNDTVDLSLLQDLTWECIAQRYFKLWQELSQKAQLRVGQQ